MKNLTTRFLAAFVAIGCSMFAVSAATLGYWDFDDGEVGADVTSEADKSGAGGCGIALVGAAVGSGVMPKYSDDTPGRYIYSRLHGGTLLTSNARGVKFAGGENGNNGSRLAGADLGSLISRQSGGFTLEFFFREDDFYQWRLYAGATIGRDNYFDLAGRNTSTMICAMTNSTTTIVPVNTEWSKSEGWHHFALRWNGSDGKIDTYVDYALHSPVYDWQNPEKTGVPWYFGCHRGGNGGCFNGKIAAIRLSSGVLKPEEFLVARSAEQAAWEGAGSTTLLFSDFSEGTVGAEPAALPIATHGELCSLNAFRNASGGVYPVYTNDVPGKFLLSKAVGGTVLSTSPKSFYVTGKGGVRARGLTTLLSRTSAFTIECFVKSVTEDNWQTFSRVSLGNVITAIRNTGNQFTLQTTTGNKNYTGNASWAGCGQWHHVAVTWDGTTRMYVDRELLRENSDIPTIDDLLDTIQHLPFGGTETSGSFRGLISGVRVSSAALAPEEMLVATETLGGAWDDKHTLFHWGFDEDSATNGAEIVVGTADPLNAAQLRPIGAYSGSLLPQYDRTAINLLKTSICSGGDLRGVNRAAAKFFGPDETRGTWASSQLFMKRTLSDMNLTPDTMTYEFFFRRNLAEGVIQSGANGQTVASHGPSDISAAITKCDWILEKGRDADDFSFYYYNATGSAVSATVATLTDDAWHHFALVKTGDNFKVYLDGVEKISKSDGIRSTTGSVYTFGAGYGIGGFQGWIDEVRLSDIARDPSDFLRFRSDRGMVRQAKLG